MMMDGAPGRQCRQRQQVPHRRVLPPRPLAPPPRSPPPLVVLNGLAIVPARVGVHDGNGRDDGQSSPLLLSLLTVNWLVVAFPPLILLIHFLTEGRPSTINYASQQERGDDRLLLSSALAGALYPTFYPPPAAAANAATGRRYILLWSTGERKTDVQVWEVREATDNACKKVAHVEKT
jgi:hypothetical protein